MASEREPASVLSKVSTQLAAIEKRDWELWFVVVVTGILVGAGLLALIFPAAYLAQKNLQMEIQVPREVFFGLVALLILFNTYVISRRLELRRTRSALISTTIQSELVRLQSFTDPLTEVYNRRALGEMTTVTVAKVPSLLTVGGLLTEIPAPGVKSMLLAEKRYLPFTVMVNVVPICPLIGLIPAISGCG